MIVLTFRRVHIKYSTKQKAVFRRYCDTYASVREKATALKYHFKFFLFKLHLLTNRRRYSSYLLPAVRGWLRLYWCWSSGEDATRRDAIRHKTELSRDNYLRDAASDVSVLCVGRRESVSLFGVSGVGGAKVHKSDLVTVSIKALDSPPPHPFHSKLLTISPFS